MITLLGIHWNITKYALIPLIILPILFCLLAYRYKKISHTITVLAGARERILFLHTSLIRRLLKVIILMIGSVFLSLALLQPGWGKEEQTVVQYGRDLFIALDISRSMLAQDVVPSRLYAAKNIIKQIVLNLSCERVGLVLFAGSAFVQCPLTEDHAAFTMFLDHVDADTISSGSTSLEQALTHIMDAYERIPQKKHKIAVIISDGEDFSRNLQSVIERARNVGLTLFVIGIGTESGAPIPLYDIKGTAIGHQKDTKGNVIISRYDEQTLHTLLDNTDNYLHATDDQINIKKIVQTIQAIEKERFDNKTWTDLRMQYPYFLAVALICFAFEWLL